MGTEMKVAEHRLFQVLTNWQRDLDEAPRADMSFTDNERRLVVESLLVLAEHGYRFGVESPISLMILTGVYLSKRSDLDLLVSVLPKDPRFTGLLRTFVQNRYDYASSGSAYERKIGRFLQVLEGKPPRKVSPPKDWFAEEVVERGQITPAPSGASDASSVTGNPVISWGETGFSDPHTTIHCV